MIHASIKAKGDDKMRKFWFIWHMFLSLANFAICAFSTWNWLSWGNLGAGIISGIWAEEDLKKIKEDQKGTAAIEYALLVAMIAGIIVVAVGLLGDSVHALFDSLNAIWPSIP
jgi:Flp pilus assembly pilin Flp